MALKFTCRFIDRTVDLWVPDLNLPDADMLPASYVQSEAVRLEIYARATRCRSEDEMNDLEDETSRRFGKLPPAARDFFAAARLRIDCRRRGIVRTRCWTGGGSRNPPTRKIAEIKRAIAAT